MGNTALIIEDDRDQAEVLARLVRRLGLRPVAAAAGEPGFRLARQIRPEVILLDLMLPDTDGFEICRRLRGERRTIDIPVIMISALDGSGYRHRGFRVGANAYLAKPFEPAELFDAIDAARSWREALRQGRMKGEIHLELNSATTFLQEVNDFLTDLYASTPLAPEQIMQLRQAVMEIGQNAIEWGNRHRIEALVRITYRVFEDRVEIIVRDSGPGFDRGNLPHAASADDPLRHLDVREKLGLREGGFGMMICRGMVDELRYNDSGNEVTLIKHFPAVGVHRG